MTTSTEGSIMPSKQDGLDMERYVTRPELHSALLPLTKSIEHVAQSVVAVAAKSDENASEVLRRIDRLATSSDRKNLYTDRRINESQRPPYQLIMLCFVVFTFGLSVAGGIFAFMDSKLQSSERGHQDKFELRMDSALSDIEKRSSSRHDKLDGKLESLILKSKLP